MPLFYANSSLINFSLSIGLEQWALIPDLIDSAMSSRKALAERAIIFIFANRIINSLYFTKVL